MLYNTKKKSIKNSLNKEELSRIAKNAFIFAIPAILVLLGDIVAQLPEGTPTGVFMLYLLNLLMDTLRKYRSGK